MSSFFERVSEEPANIGIVLDNEDPMGVRRISSVSHFFILLVPHIRGIEFVFIKGCGCWSTSSWMGLDDFAGWPGRCLSSLRRSTQGDLGREKRPTGPLGLVRVQSQTNGCIMSADKSRPGWQRYESMQRDQSAAFGHPLI